MVYSIVNFLLRKDHLNLNLNLNLKKHVYMHTYYYIKYNKKIEKGSRVWMSFIQINQCFARS